MGPRGAACERTLSLRIYRWYWCSFVQGGLWLVAESAILHTNRRFVLRRFVRQQKLSLFRYCFVLSLAALRKPCRLTYLERSFMGHCGKEPDPQKNLMEVYREFGLHQFSPSTLVPTYTCGDERFARSLLYGAGKHFPHPMRCGATCRG